MKIWVCDNGKAFLAFKDSCFFCEHGEVFWDYTNGPYLVVCDTDKNTVNGMAGKC